MHLASLARWSSQLRYEDIPPRTLRAARTQLLSTIAAAHASSGAAEVRPVVAALSALAGPGEGRATVFGTGARLPVVEAAMANAAFSMAHDFDDIIWMGHTCHSAVFAPLAVAEQERAEPRALLTAIVVANEVAGRLGASSFLGPLNGQMWTFIHLAGAAAATAKLLGLDAEKTTHALGIALAQPNFALQPGFMAPTSKLLAASTPLATGIRAAYFARAGMTGHAGILEDRRGFWRRFSFLPMPFMLEGLGEFWALDTLQIKSFPGCHYFQTALTAVERILGRRGRLPEDEVLRVTVDSTKLGCEVTRFAGDYVMDGDAVTPVRVNFDLAASCAIFLHAGRLTPDEMDAAWMQEHQAALGRWLGRIRVRHDPALTAKVIGGARGLATGRKAVRALKLGDLRSLSRRYADEYGSTLFSAADLRTLLSRAGRKDPPRPSGDAPTSDGVPLYFPNRVTVELQSGEREEERVDLPVGSMASPHAADTIGQKVLASLGRTVGASRAKAALEAGRAAESLTLAQLVAALSV